MPAWDGVNRRSDTDHDHITRMIEVQGGILGELREIKTDFKNHMADDNTRFTKILWNLGIGVGIVLTVNAAIGFLIMAKH